MKLLPQHKQKHQTEVLTSYVLLNEEPRKQFS